MPELKIEVKNNGLANGEQITELITPEDINIKIYDGETLVAETNLENLVKKFLLVSSQYAQLAAAFGVIQDSSKGKIILPGETNE